METTSLALQEHPAIVTNLDSTWNALSLNEVSFSVIGWTKPKLALTFEQGRQCSAKTEGLSDDKSSCSNTSTKLG